MEAILRRRNLILIPKNMKKIVDFTLTEENYSEYTFFQYNINYVVITKDDEDNALNLKKGFGIVIDIPTNTEWTSSNCPSMFLAADFTSISVNNRKDIATGMKPVAGAASSRLWLVGTTLEDCTCIHGTYIIQNAGDLVSPNLQVKQDAFISKVGVVRLALGFGRFTPEVGTRIRVYSE